MVEPMRGMRSFPRERPAPRPVSARAACWLHRLLPADAPGRHGDARTPSARRACACKKTHTKHKQEHTHKHVYTPTHTHTHTRRDGSSPRC